MAHAARSQHFRRIGHALIVEPQDLRNLCGLLSQDQGKVSVSASCIDGTRLEFAGLDDLLAFENPTYRRLETVEIDARTSSGRTSIAICEDDRTTAEVSVVHADDGAALRLREEILGRFGEMRPAYSWLSRYSLYEVVLRTFVALYILLLVLRAVLKFQSVLSSSSSTSFMEHAVNGVTICLFAGAALYPFERLRKWLFPLLVFDIGRQSRDLERRKSWRGYIFNTLLIGIAASVIAGFILRWL